ncbi:T9SS type A sorting domain-containing protein [Candidatus Poribacteria bacterium]|nr:T9SS type A sorting domain-containing protein [Candidatus Poribacteria bacterium]
MKMLDLNWKVVLSTLVMVVLICGLQGVSYSQICQVGDVLRPGESCTDPGTGDDFSVLANGSGRYLFFTAGTGINLRGNINGKQRNFVANKQNDGSWKIEAVTPGGGGTTARPPPQPEAPVISVPRTPDLVVDAVQAEPSTVAPGEQFRLYAILKNNGTGESTPTTLRYYRSTDAVISTEDTQLRSANRDALAANATIHRYLTVTVPTTPGTYYYGACVDSVTDESDTDNNCSMAVSVTVTAPPVVPEDVNDDGVVDVQDLVSVAQQYGQTGTTTGDVNGDGVVNIDDLLLVTAVLDANAAAAPSLHSDALAQLTVADVKLWLSQARQRSLTDLSVRRGVLFLEQLLGALVPQETALLANYPNPFNPETWIPYQLETSAEVTLTIYAVDGQAVRQLALGHQAAGTYQTRSRAAHWNGRNEYGEPVASGLYFYTLTTGDFTATRKMLILK